ncbi:Fc.00g011310.m01.CDS01 [Cosmosporella sp. VM-42]
MLLKHIAIVGGFLGQLCSGFLSHDTGDEKSSSVAIPPSQDPWYIDAPHGFESTVPGTILRLRPAPGNLTAAVGNCSEAYNILYRTTDSRYKPTYAVTTLYVPKKLPEHSSTRSLLSYQVPYNSVNVDSSPSFSFHEAPFPEIGEALGRGWYVLVPDFEGPTAANVAGILEAHAVLDSIRATLKSTLVGPSSTVRTAVWGYSGGSIATEWALEFQEQYAPELNISGAALGGLVPNTTDVIATRAPGTVYGSHAIVGLLGILSQYPDAYKYLLSQLKTDGPYNKTEFLAIQHMDYNEGHIHYMNQSIYDYFINGEEIMHAPQIKYALQRNTIMTYHGVPQVPLFLYKAINDAIVPIPATDDWYNRSCSLGVNIRYERNTLGGHVAELVNGDPRVFPWLQTIFDATYKDSGCISYNVTFDVTGGMTD